MTTGPEVDTACVCVTMDKIINKWNKKLQNNKGNEPKQSKKITNCIQRNQTMSKKEQINHKIKITK